ncbi:MAG: hypothetical protein MK180_11065 [Rhodobacteraceae bacterium]|nr:hypothetical protein [Paracoccaceae bacterium]
MSDGRVKFNLPEDLTVTLATRPTANSLRNSIENSIEDGVLDVGEKAEIGAQYLALGGLLTVEDDGTIVAETSPLFGQDLTTVRTDGSAYGSYNKHSSIPYSFPSIARPGFELHGLDSFNEFNFPVASATAPEDVGTSPVIPGELETLFHLIENGKLLWLQSEDDPTGDGAPPVNPVEEAPEPLDDLLTGEEIEELLQQSGSSSSGGSDPDPRPPSVDYNEAIHGTGGVKKSDITGTTNGILTEGPHKGDVVINDKVYDGDDPVFDLEGPEAAGTFTTTSGGGGKPVILDLNGDGVEVGFGQDIFFDVDGDGYLEKTSWAGADDGFLVVDLPSGFDHAAFDFDWSSIVSDGQIDQAHELAFAVWGSDGATDLQGLAEAFDSNDDDVLNSADAAWSHLRIFQDLDQDGEVDAGELKTLAEWGITEVGLTYDDRSSYSDTSDDITVFGNTLHGLASYTHDGSVIATQDADGEDIGSTDSTTGLTTVAGGVGDMFLSADELGFRRVETEYGYAIEFENGASSRYADVEGKASPDADLTANNLDGAFGDDRNNQLRALGHIAAVQISGGLGNDLVQGGWGDDFLSGDAGVDNIQGGGGHDVIFFDADDSFVNGGVGRDIAIVVDDGTSSAPGITLDLEATLFEVVYGGAGADAFSVSSDLGLDVQMSGGDGADTLTGGAGDDGLSGDAGNDQLSGGRGDDVVSGGDGADTMSGDAGDDLLMGGDGADSASGGDGDDQLFGDGGNDTLLGDSGDDFLVGGDGDDSLVGGNDDDQLIGGDGADTLDGGSGDDRLDGGLGNDSLISGSGDTYLTGGEGDDTFVLQHGGDHHAVGGLGDDTFHVHDSNLSKIVQGGEGTDVLLLDGLQSQYDFTYTATTVQQPVDANFSGSGSPATEWVPKGTAQYIVRAVSGSGITNHIHIQDIEQVVFGDGTTITLAHTDAAADNSETFLDFHEHWGVDCH